MDVDVSTTEATVSVDHQLGVEGDLADLGAHLNASEERRFGACGVELNTEPVVLHLIEVPVVLPVLVHEIVTRTVGRRDEPVVEDIVLGRRVLHRGGEAGRDTSVRWMGSKVSTQSR
ncbi:MAG: hypothetical protein ACJATT_005058 [Myxococcota bacterium]|jgi:hypothetical protein